MTATITSPRHEASTAAGVVRRTAGNAPLAVLLLAAFVPPWLVWGSKIAQSHQVLGWHLPQGIALWVMVPALVGAAAAVGGRAALRDLGARLVRWRVPVRCYLVAVAAPVVVAALAVAVTTLAGGAVHLGSTLSLGAAAGYLVYGTGLFLLTEEAAWRGLLLPRLQARLRPVPATLVLGLVWGLWHVQLLHVPGESDQGLPLTAFLLLILATSVLISTVVNAARGSVLVAAVFHAAFDAAYSYAGVVGADHAVLWAATGISVVAAAGVLVVTRGRLGLGPAS